jgi:hypothetical protein
MGAIAKNLLNTKNTSEKKQNGWLKTGRWASQLII